MSLRERAFEAYQAETERRAAEYAAKELVRQITVRAACRTIFGVEPENIDSAAGEVMVEGILLEYDLSGGCCFTLLGACPECGDQYPGHSSFDTLAGLGEALNARFVPVDHECETPKEG